MAACARISSYRHEVNIDWEWRSLAYHHPRSSSVWSGYVVVSYFWISDMKEPNPNPNPNPNPIRLWIGHEGSGVHLHRDIQAPTLS